MYIHIEYVLIITCTGANDAHEYGLCDMITHVCTSTYLAWRYIDICLCGIHVHVHVHVHVSPCMEMAYGSVVVLFCFVFVRSRIL